jgi:hypothetical protein
MERIKVKSTGDIGYVLHEFNDGRLVISFGDVYTYVYNISEVDKILSFSPPKGAIIK